MNDTFRTSATGSQTPDPRRHALVFSTSRLVRDYRESRDDTLLPKLYTMDTFLSRCVVVEERRFVDETRRLLLLYEATEQIDVGRLGIKKSFVEFVKDAPFVVSFFKELHAERAGFDALKRSDTYAEYDEHLGILQALYENYCRLLEERGLTDTFVVDDYRLAERFLDRFSRIDIHVDGYLSRFELEVLKKIDVPLFLHLHATPYNAKVAARLGIEPWSRDEKILYDLKAGEVVEREKIPPLDPGKISTAAFAERIDQAAFVLHHVARFVEEGADPANVAVIVPDEDFAHYLKLFDRFGNFNYAMGEPFDRTLYYRRLADLRDALARRSEHAVKKMENDPLKASFEAVKSFDDFVDFLTSLTASSQEAKLVDEKLHRFRRYGPLLPAGQKRVWLNLWLRELQELAVDDIRGGKITVMGLLESRGKSFDGVVVVDFNEESVPRRNQKDLFLNSKVRRGADMPTRTDKENLQKHYYYRLFQSAKRAAVCWVETEEALPSRFLDELEIPKTGLQDGRYRPLILPSVGSTTPKPLDYRGDNPFLRVPELTPSKLKDYLVCPRRFYHKYIQHIMPCEEESEPNTGTLIHEALEQTLAAGVPESPEAYFQGVMDRLFAQVQEPVERFNLTLEWHDRLENFCRKDWEVLQKYSVVGREEWVECSYGGFRLSAKADRIETGGEEVRFIDYKTSANLDKTVKDKNDFQLLFYHLIAQEKFPGKKVRTLYWDIHAGKLRQIDPTENLERFDGVLKELATAETLEYTQTEELASCRYCHYRTACRREGA